MTKHDKVPLHIDFGVVYKVRRSLCKYIRLLLFLLAYPLTICPPKASVTKASGVEEVEARGWFVIGGDGWVVYPA